MTAPYLIMGIIDFKILPSVYFDIRGRACQMSIVNSEFLSEKLSSTPVLLEEHYDLLIESPGARVTHQ